MNRTEHLKKRMTLYQFNRLSEEEQIKTVWSIGVFLDNHISKTEMLSCYAIVVPN